jgi:hypothetical protein
VNKFVRILKKIFGFLMLAVLFAGGISLIGYVAAIFIGGEPAVAICTFIFKKYFPVIIRITAATVLLGLAVMYLDGQVALTIEKNKTKGDTSK